jgi:ribonuclease P protein component
LEPNGLIKNTVALKRALRLRKSKDFQRVRQQGRSMVSRLLILTFAKNELAMLRIGFVVSKRVSKQAVKRNYVKRLLSEAIRPVLIGMPTGWDIVISAKTSVIDAKLPNLVDDLRILLRRARLLDLSTMQEVSTERAQGPQT